MFATIRIINLVLYVDAGHKSRLVSMKTAYAGPNSDEFIPTKESHRFPEMPALPPLVSMLDQLDHQLESYPFCLFVCFQIDTIDPVPGVTVREGGRIMCGVKRHQSLQPPTS